MRKSKGKQKKKRRKEEKNIEKGLGASLSAHPLNRPMAQFLFPRTGTLSSSFPH
jgi:hypothetical protein